MHAETATSNSVINTWCKICCLLFQCFYFIHADIKVTHISGKIKLTCKDKWTITGGTGGTEGKNSRELDYNDDNTNEYTCQPPSGTPTKIYVKFRSKFCSKHLLCICDERKHEFCMLLAWFALASYYVKLCKHSVSCQ